VLRTFLNIHEQQQHVTTRRQHVVAHARSMREARSKHTCHPGVLGTGPIGGEAIVTGGFGQGDFYHVRQDGISWKRIESLAKAGGLRLVCVARANSTSNKQLWSSRRERPLG